MRIGLSATVQHYLDKDMAAALDELFVMVRHARDNGWDLVGCGQHYLNEGENQMPQMVPMLARLQAEAGDMWIAFGILLVNLHNPVYIAETVASMDIICRGRFIFGVGLGYREVEFEAFGVPKGQRLNRFLDNLDLSKQLLRGEEVSFDSDYCRLNKARLNIQPIQKPHPPIFVAANADKMVVRAAHIGDTWAINPHSTGETIHRQLELYRAELKKLGKPQPTILPCSKEIFCAKDRKTAIEKAGQYLGGKYQNYALWGQDKVMPSGENFSQPFEELLKDRFVLGSPEECYEQLRPYWEAYGINQFTFRTRWPGMPLETCMESMRLISTELIPELKKATPRQF